MPSETPDANVDSKQKRSCRACRKLKMKCWEGPGGTSCQRCRRLEIECDYSRERRGRKTNAEREALRSRDTADRDSADPALPVAAVDDPPAPGPSRSAGPMDQPLGDIVPGNTLPVSLDFQANGQAQNFNSLFHTVQSAGSGPLPSSISPHTLSTATPNRQTETNPTVRKQNMDVSEILDPDGRGTRSRSGAEEASKSGTVPGVESDWQGRRMFEDPIDLQYLTYGEAQVLVRLFHDKLNPLIALLDPHLHTLDYVRESSSVLFTAVLAAASKFFRKELHAALLSHAHSILNRATNKAACSTGIIQALMILVYWKAPSDRSGWLKIGMAVRMGYQLGWHVVPNRVLPMDEMEARRLLDAERTWFCWSKSAPRFVHADVSGLICFDRTYAMIFGLPSYVRVGETGDAEAWALEHLYLNVAVDMHLASSIQAPDGHEHWREFRRQMDTLPPRLVLQFIDDAIAQTQRHTEKWHGVNKDPRLYIQPGELPILRWWDRSLLFDLQTRKLDYLNVEDARTATPQCLNYALQCVEEIELLADGGQLLFLQDAGSVSLSGFGVLMRKLFRRLSSSQRIFALEMIKRVFHSCERVAANDETAVTAYSARFLKRVLQTISSESRVASRHASPRLDIDQYLMEPLPSQENAAVDELNAFLQMTTTEPNQFAADQLYWSSLFSTNHDPGVLTVPYA